MFEEKIEKKKSNVSNIVILLVIILILSSFIIWKYESFSKNTNSRNVNGVNSNYPYLNGEWRKLQYNMNDIESGKLSQILPEILNNHKKYCTIPFNESLINYVDVKENSEGESIKCLYGPSYPEVEKYQASFYPMFKGVVNKCDSDTATIIKYALKYDDNHRALPVLNTIPKNSTEYMIFTFACFPKKLTEQDINKIGCNNIIRMSPNSTYIYKYVVIYDVTNNKFYY